MAAAAPSSDAAAADAPLEERPPPEVERAQFWEGVHKSQTEHAAEPADPDWSRKTNALLSADLGRLASSGHFAVEQVDCRTTTCEVHVRWPTRSAAMDEYHQLVHHPYRANCGRSLVIEPEVQPDGSVAGLMMLDCEGWRADGDVEVDMFRPAKAAGHL